MLGGDCLCRPQRLAVLKVVLFMAVVSGDATTITTATINITTTTTATTTTTNTEPPAHNTPVLIPCPMAAEIADGDFVCSANNQ